MHSDAPIINDRLKTIKDIYNILKENKVFPKNMDINHLEILKTLYFMNKLFYETYLIFRNKKLTRQQKIAKLTSFKNPYTNEILFNIPTANKMLDHYADPITKTYDILINSIKRYKKLIDKLNNKKKTNTDKRENFKGGFISVNYPGSDTYSNNPFTGQAKKLYKNALDPNNFKNAEEYVKALYSKEHMKNVQNMLGIEDIGSVINKLENKVGSDELKRDPDLRNILIKALRFNIINLPVSTYKTYQYLFDWIFFPIYQLEQIPVYGVFLEYPLDVVTLILEEMNLFIKPWAKILPLMLDLLTYMGQIYPGVGWAVSLSKVPVMFLRWPIEHFTERGAQMILFFIQIQRKQLTEAWMNLGAIFPLFMTFFQPIDDILLSINTINPHINKYTGYANTALHTTRVLSKPFLDDPLLMFDPKKIWNTVIKPNEAIVPFLKDMPTELKWAGYKLYQLFELTQDKLSDEMRTNLEQENIDQENIDEEDDIDEERIEGE